MSQKSIKDIIKREITLLENDLSILEQELSQLLSFDNQYKSVISIDIESSKRTSIYILINKIRNEIELYKKAFSDEMCKDIDYIFELYPKVPKYANKRAIIQARVDIVRFNDFGINKSNYLFTKNKIDKKSKEISKYCPEVYFMEFPKQPKEVLNELCYFLFSNDLKAMTKKEEHYHFLPKDTIKDIVNIISDFNRLPKGQEKFDIEMNSLFYS